jgi:hypothetical protein
MGLFTFIMGYLEGTYISQVEAIDTEQARHIWIRNLEIQKVDSFTVEDKETIIKENFLDEDMVQIKGTKNVWFFMVRTKMGYGHVNVVKTKL